MEFSNDAQLGLKDVPALTSNDIVILNYLASAFWLSFCAWSFVSV